LKKLIIRTEKHLLKYEVCGINIKDVFKWQTIIHNASPIDAYHNENNAKETSGRGSTL
jgi:hypothetical protein